jgi:hypothetical protein
VTPVPAQPPGWTHEHTGPSGGQILAAFRDGPFRSASSAYLRAHDPSVLVRAKRAALKRRHFWRATFPSALRYAGSRFPRSR